jgi:hypothetical protein
MKFTGGEFLGALFTALRGALFLLGLISVLPWQCPPVCACA